MLVRFVSRWLVPARVSPRRSCGFATSSTPAVTDELPMQTTRMILRLASPAAMPNGSTRLVARIDGSLPGMAITPAANQTSAQTIVLAHLKHAPLPVPKVDVNLIGDLRPRCRDEDQPDEQAKPEDETQSTRQTMITLNGFGKDYGDFTAVESIDLADRCR